MTRTRIYLADGLTVERTALRLVVQNLDMQVVGEAANWATTLAQAPATQLDMLLVDWNLLPLEAHVAMAQLRAACISTITIVLISQLAARQQAAISTGADVFISKSEPPDRVAEQLRLATGISGRTDVIGFPDA